MDSFGLPVASSGRGLDQFGLAPTSGDRFGGDGPDVAGSEGYDADADRFGFEAAAPRPGPRIEPSPPPQRGKLWLGIIAGLVAGLVLFGTGGFFAGRTTAPGADPQPTGPGPTAAGEPSLGVYEQNQVALNRGKLIGPLAPLSQAWQPRLSNCERNGAPNGPALQRGEKARVRCRFGAMSVIFVEYISVVERDKARVQTLSQNVDARSLTPGVAATAAERPSPSGRTTGSYVEYAYVVVENNVRQTIAGLWWDDTKSPAAAYMLAYWNGGAGAGKSWAPMRDLWARYA